MCICMRSFEKVLEPLFVDPVDLIIIIIIYILYTINYIQKLVIYPFMLTPYRVELCMHGWLKRSLYDNYYVFPCVEYKSSLFPL